MQKTAYEMRISDWSSDVCSSDLEDDVLRRQVGDRLAVLLDLYLAGTVQAGVAVDHRDLVLLQQEGDSAGELLRHAARPLHHLGEVEGDVLRAEAVGVEIVEDVVDLRRAQQRLGRDAAPVEADAAEMLALHHGRSDERRVGKEGGSAGRSGGA